jgi:3-phosphoglycerate kinase
VDTAVFPLQADVVAIGGRMAFTFLAALGVRVGRTQVEDAWVQVGVRDTVMGHAGHDGPHLLVRQPSQALRRIMLPVT